MDDIKKGRYVGGEHQPNLVVVDVRRDEDVPESSWVAYRLEWEPDELAVPVSWTTFRQLMEMGYKLDEEGG